MRQIGGFIATWLRATVYDMAANLTTVLHLLYARLEGLCGIMLRKKAPLLSSVGLHSFLSLRAMHNLNLEVVLLDMIII